jgi:hypothetical protein
MLKKFTLATAVATLIGMAGVAHADPLPNLTNLDFTQYTGSAPKGPFTSVNPVGWTGGSGLIFIDGPSAAASAAGPVYLQTYGNPTGAVTGNYVEADGNPTYESGFNYEVTGLTAGKTYSLSFYQGASQQTGFGNGTPTTNQWIVSLGTQGMQLASGGPVDPTYGPTDTYFNADPNASVAASPLMTVASGGTFGWQYVTVNLTADASTDLLSFLAWGDNGSTINLPPIAFLAGVDSPPGLGSDVPEPGTWGLLVLGFGGLGLTLRARHKSNRKTQALASQA